MLFWFLATSVFTVFFVFRSPAFDYRPLMVGSLIPLAGLVAGMKVLHSMVFAVAFLAVVMLATIGHRLVRRRLLGLPVGLMLHLVFTGAWTNDKLFGWPLFGWDIGDATHPVVARGWWNVPLEVAGLVGCYVIARRIDWRSGRIASLP
ncbi:MAG TPA: hypothetical protein VNQ73_14300 [Ilumatobacter sp.]|nr:hypothetical protein [Ilumatobacter sp.]